MRRALLGGTLYFGIVFAIGFLLGVLRTAVLEPRLGALAATSLELPVMLAASWVACGWAIVRCAVPPLTKARAAMGLWALALLMAAEIALGVALARPLAEQWVALGGPAGLLGLAAQIAFGLFPLIRRRWELGHGANRG